MVVQPRRGRDLLVVGLLVGLYVLSAWATRPGVVDDAYISARYARLWAEGCGLRYNCGLPPIEGYTNFLWVVLLVPAAGLPVHPADWATGLGLVFGGVTVAATVWAARGEGATAVASWAAGLLVAALPAFGVASTNGLETSLYTALLLVAAGASRRERRDAGLWAGLLYLVRPEGLVVGALLAVATRSPRSVTLWATVVAAYFAGRWAWFGTLVPNTWAAQARDRFSVMWEMNHDYLVAGLPTWIGFAVLVLVAAHGRAWRLLGLALGLAALALQVFNWMPGLRLFLPSMVLLAVAAAPTFGRHPWLHLPAGLWLGWLQLDQRDQQVAYDGHHTALPDNGAERLGREIAAMAPPGSWLLIRDAGVTAYFAGPAVNVLDIHPYSLTDPTLTGRAFDRDYVLDRDVAFVVTTGRRKDEVTQYATERQLLADPRLHDFTQAGTWLQHHRRWYTLFVRPDLSTGP